MQIPAGNNVNNLSALLQQLQRELNVLHDPQRDALQYLKANALGHVEEPYNDAAFRVCLDLYRHQADNIDVVHHLAIMYHARAFDQELEGDTKTADKDWYTALKLWHRVWLDDDFWERLSKSLASATKPIDIDAIRDEFVMQLLRIHYDISFDSGLPNYRSRIHIKLLLSSPFPKSFLSRIRDSYFDDFTKELNPAIWNKDSIDPVLAETGLAKMYEILQVDPSHLKALQWLLRFLMRSLTSQNTELGALQEAPVARKKLLQKIAQDAEKWHSYLDILAEQNDSLEDYLRQYLNTWYRVMAEVQFALDRFEQSIKYYQCGIQVGRENEDEYLQCLRGIDEARVIYARYLFDHKRYIEAEEKIEQAINGYYRLIQKTSSDASLRHELAQLLTAWAIRKVNLIMESNDSSMEENLNTCKNAERWLIEAVIWTSEQVDKLPKQWWHMELLANQKQGLFSMLEADIFEDIMAQLEHDDNLASIRDIIVQFEYLEKMSGRAN